MKSRIIHLFVATAAALVFGVAAANAELTPTGPQGAVTTSERGTFFLFPTCAGEDIEFTGSLHTVTRSAPDGAGGTHFLIEATLNFVGVGTTGNRYVLAQGTHFEINFTNGALENGGSSPLRILSAGPAPNLYGTLRAHGVVTPTGELRAIFFYEDFRCE